MVRQQCRTGKIQQCPRPRGGSENRRRLVVGDREEYRLVVYTAAGRFVKTIQMRNLMCTVAFDPHGNLWVASGQDGQLLKIDENGTCLAPLGRGSGFGYTGQFIETNYMSWDKLRQICIQAIPALAA